MPTAVFTYGTLQPGHLRWGLLAPHAIDHVPTTVAGGLFDTGEGWPAARFVAPIGVASFGDIDAGDTIPGWWVQLAPAGLDRLLAQLDEVEGAVPPGAGADPVLRAPGLADGRYRRVAVRTEAGDAWAYEALHVDPAWSRTPAWTTQPEN